MKKTLLMMAALGLFTACGSGSDENGTTHSVMTVQPIQVGGQSVKHFSGMVKEDAEISLGFKTAGQLQQIYVKEGDYVRQGQLLARLDDSDYLLGVQAAEAQYNQLHDEVARLEKLYAGKSISKNDLQKAQAGLEQVEVNLKNNRNKVDYTRLYAPQSGYVQSVNFEKAEMVNAGTGVFTLLSGGELQVEVNIPASLYVQQAQMERYEGTVMGQTYPLQLVSITPKADNNQLYRAVFNLKGVDRKEARVTSGMNVSVDIYMAASSGQAGYQLPIHALFEDSGKSYVWVVQADSTVARREVQLSGTDETGNALVSSGLQGSEQVVKAGVNVLLEGEKVKVIGQPSATNIGGLK